MHTEHRTWFPFILVGLTLALILGVFVWLQSPSGGDVQELQVFAPSAEEYEQNIVEVIMAFEAGESTQSVYEDILNTRVPSEYKDFHLQLVLLFAQASLDSGFDILTELATLRENYPWLP